MDWLVVTQSSSTSPSVEVVEVRTFAVRAETPSGVRAAMQQHQSSQTIRGIMELQKPGKDE